MAPLQDEKTKMYLKALDREDLVVEEKPGVNIPVWTDPDKSGTPVPTSFNPMAPAPGTPIEKPPTVTGEPAKPAGGEPPPQPTPSPTQSPEMQQIMNGLSQITANMTTLTNRLSALEQGGVKPTETPQAQQPQGYGDLIEEAKSQAETFIENPAQIVSMLEKFSQRAESQAEQNAMLRLAKVMPQIFEETKKLENQVEAWFRQPENADLLVVQDWVQKQASELRSAAGNRGSILDYLNQAAPLVRNTLSEVVKAKTEAAKKTGTAGVALPGAGGSPTQPPTEFLTETQKLMRDKMGVQIVPPSKLNQ